VIGVGINVFLSPSARKEIEVSGAMVAAVGDTCTAPPSRNMIAGSILDELLHMLSIYESEGFSAYRDAWTALDGLRDRAVQVSMGVTLATGTARGVDNDGALLLEGDEGVRRFMSGEASLRLIEDVI
jgi:BirA family biotin operon repressor/biotin-[acetyl-CoA-carboxylase] ligase